MKDKIIQIMTDSSERPLLGVIFGLSESGKLYKYNSPPEKVGGVWQLMTDSPERELSAPVEEVEEIKEINGLDVSKKLQNIIDVTPLMTKEKLMLSSLIVGYTNKINQLIVVVNKLAKKGI